jgi:predicted TIM-barrel fold metal-dependent hydrolase
MVGIKLAHAHQHFRMDDPRYFSIYALAASSASRCISTPAPARSPGTAQDPPYTDPAYLEPAIARPSRDDLHPRPPRLRLQEQQLGALAGCIDLAGRYPTCTSSRARSAASSSDPSGANLKEVMRRIREAGVVDRAIYGSDGPAEPGLRGRLPRAHRRRHARAAGYSRDEMAAVLAGNFVRVFAVAEPAR